jgi:hypothetical protein
LISLKQGVSGSPRAKADRRKDERIPKKGGLFAAEQQNRDAQQAQTSQDQPQTNKWAKTTIHDQPHETSSRKEYEKRV